MSAPLLLAGGRLLDPWQSADGPADIRVEGGRVAAVGPGLPRAGVEVVELAGAWVLPGCMDMHVHLRTPGRSDEETVATGLAAAARGGFTDVACMPNTDPPLDSPALILSLLSQARQAGTARLHPVAAATAGCRGEAPADLPALFAAGAVAASDDGDPVRSPGAARQVMAWLAAEGRTLVEHAEDPALSGSGVMHEGRVSLELGRDGIPAASEELCVERDIVLARLTGARVHFAHVSTASAVAAIRRARAEGLRVTGETAPHYLWFTDEDTRAHDGSFRVNPPLRSAEHREALFEALGDGTLTALATDHAPHSSEEKARPFGEAPPGFVGLETALAASHTALVVSGRMSPLVWAWLWARGPREALGLPSGPVVPGASADLTVFDPLARWTVRAADFASKCRNTPFEGREMLGRPVLTLLEGRVTHSVPSPLAGARA
ncbi:MAG TPA: dihydroorotase [Candidatus Saccharimonadales bacterium]|nr:dihydroorotase [Candidatus Saccharimonadales bacterium]